MINREGQMRATVDTMLCLEKSNARVARLREELRVAIANKKKWDEALFDWMVEEANERIRQEREYAARAWQVLGTIRQNVPPEWYDMCQNVAIKEYES